MNLKQKEREHQLEKTKMQLIARPEVIFFTSILFSLVYKWKESISTAATDGRHMFVNPEFFDSLTIKERQGVFVHEVLHVALNHITRSMKHEAYLSNVAADYVTNLIVLDAGFTLPKGCLVDRRFKNMAYEEVYKILLSEKKQREEATGKPEDNTGKSIPGIGSDILPPADQAEADNIQAEVADMVLRATIQAQQTNSWGSIPGAVLIELDKTLNPRLPWDVLFQNYMNQFAKEDYSWTKPNRRYLPNLIMPSQYSEAVSNMVFAVDCSGSVSDEEFGYFAQEVEVVQQQLQPELITLISFNSKITGIHEITQSLDIMKDIKFTGRGGTNIKEVLTWAEENEPEILVIFTDGYFGQPPADQYPLCHILWLIHNNNNFHPKMGEVIHYEL